MDERKIARTVAEAEVGDMLWHYDRYRDRYDEKGKWLGRGAWTLVTVFKIARIYLTAGDPKWPRSAGEFNIDTGTAKTAGGYTPSEHVAGSKDRADAFWIARAGEMGSAITRSKDIEVLKTVAFALGLDGPPDFSAPALIAQAEKEASRHG